jgi:ribonuclease T2
MLRRTNRSLDRRLFRPHLIRSCLIGLAQAVFLAGTVFLAALPPAAAQSVVQDATSTASARQVVKQGQPGKFDFYLLALSWSPSFCEASRERGVDRNNDPQCGPRPYAFVVHGLWPQYERGFPRNCQVPSPRLPRSIANAMLDLMPSPRRVFHEWDYHGTCTGLTGAQYFDTVRKARAAITIPAEYQSIGEPLTVKPADVAAAFIRVNAGLKSDALQISCDGKRLTGIRICMNKDLSFRDCAEVSKRSCRADTVVMPPVRAPHAANAN